MNHLNPQSLNTFAEQLAEPSQWTYIYWDASHWLALHQIPDPLNPRCRVISTEIARGYHDIDWEDMPRPGKPGCDYDAEYAAKQIELGLPYATREWPLKTCQGQIMAVQS